MAGLPDTLTDADIAQMDAQTSRGAAVAPDTLTDADINNLSANTPTEGDNQSISIKGLEIPTGTNLNKIQEAQNRTEEDIANRHSYIKDLIQDPTTVDRFKAHPVGTTLRTLLGAGEMIGGVTADIGLAAQRGTIHDLGKNVLKSMIGDRPAEVADILKASALPVVSNPAFATASDILLNSVKGSPMSGLGEVASKVVEPGLHALNAARKAVINPEVAKVMNFLSNVPAPHALEALNNPKYLDPKYIKQEAAAVNPLWQSTVHALEDNPNATVDLSNARSKVANLRIQTKSGELAPEMQHLTDTEQSKIKNIVDEVQHFGTKLNPISFARTRSLITKMDDILQPIYSKIEAGQPAPTEAYQRYIGQIRSAVREDLGKQYPQYDQLATRYSNLKKAESVQKSFGKTSLSFQKVLPARLALLGLGLGSHGASLAALPLTMARGQGRIIRESDAIGKLLSEPTVGLDIAKLANQGD